MFIYNQDPRVAGIKRILIKGLQNSYYKCAQGFNKTHSHNEQRNRNYREKTTD